MKKGAVRRLLRFGNRPALLAGDLGRAFHRVAQERRHVVGETRAAAFRLAITPTVGPLLTLTARLAGGFGVRMAVPRLLVALAAALRRPLAVRARRPRLLIALRV